MSCDLRVAPVRSVFKEHSWQERLSRADPASRNIHYKVTPEQPARSDTAKLLSGHVLVSAPSKPVQSDPDAGPTGGRDTPSPAKEVALLSGPWRDRGTT